ncbi:SIR2 family protein [Ulvibacterium marinum]|uniref:SIR2 family protein n=1 Tax=Ulvibacterium marinum TaxID=2419782 RepID=A0A3B0CEG3_9FLAO|nr:SIR2 family protein [Ulvibacterium marinum]RKN83481.1 SIR2 family protein [Ulvibacterium marinum]
MSIYHDPIRHLEYLRQSLSQDSKPIGFFISAGCPLSVQMPEGKWPLIPDVKNLTLWINNEMSANEKYVALLLEVDKAKKDRNNIEDILSFIRGLKQVSVGGKVRGFSEKDLESLESEVCKQIVRKINVELPNNQTPYHKLSKWISSIDREIPIDIFTTNYDLLLEDSLESLEIPYFDGFVGSKKSFFDLRAVENNLIPIHWTRLWKIHGSINWYQEEIQEQKKIYRSSEIKEDASHLIYPSHLKYEQSRKMPYLALIDQLNRFIRQKSSLLVLSGYSFNDEHLNDTIINALKANPSAMVLALMHDSYFIKDGIERYPKANKLALDRHNLNVWAFDKAIIGTNYGEWKKQKETEDKDLLRFITMEEEILQIRLGDFATFTDFLKMLIGNISETNKDSKDD